ESGGPPPAIYQPLIGLAAGSPWLQLERVSTFDAPGHVPSPQGLAVPLPFHRYQAFDPSYVQRVRDARAALQQFAMSVSGPGVPTTYRTLAADLVTAEAGSFVSIPALGLRYIDAVDTTIERAYAAASLPPSRSPTTLT